MRVWMKWPIWKWFHWKSLTQLLFSWHASSTSRSFWVEMNPLLPFMMHELTIENVWMNLPRIVVEFFSTVNAQTYWPIWFGQQHFRAHCSFITKNSLFFFSFRSNSISIAHNMTTNGFECNAKTWKKVLEKRQYLCFDEEEYIQILNDEERTLFYVKC